MKGKKFFILNDRSDVNKGYTEVTADYVRKYIKSFPEGDRAYFINLGYAVMETNEVEYRRFYREERRKRYCAEEAERVGEFSYDAPNNTELETGGSTISDYDAEPFEDNVIYRVLSEKLPEVYEILTDKEFQLIYEIYFKNISISDLARNRGITRKAVRKQRDRILEKMKNFFEN